MHLSPYQIKKIQQLKQQAFKLYKQGLTTREVGKRVGKSHAWVAAAVRELAKKGK